MLLNNANGKGMKRVRIRLDWEEHLMKGSG